MASIPECPPSLKSIQHYLKVATEHETRDPVVAYWCRLHALQVGLKLTTKKTPEETKVLMALMDWLEEAKKTMKDNDAITNEVAGQAHLENYALRLFLFADKADREQNYGKNMVKAFYTAGMIYDVLTTFGDLTDEAAQNRKYAKWKAAYIHNCLKTGEAPVPGPLQQEGEQNEESEAADPASTSTSDPEAASASGLPQAPGFPQASGFPQAPGFPQASGFPQFPSVPQVPSFPQVPGSSPAPATPPRAPSGFGTTLPPDPSVAMRAASQLPNVPYTPDPNPGGFIPYDPSSTPAPIPSTLYGDNTTTTAQITPDQIAKAQKYCKWASSALNYEDVKTAIVNLCNALELLQTGRDPA